MSCDNCIDRTCTNRCDIKLAKLANTPYEVSECGLVWNTTYGLSRLNPYKVGNILYIDMYLHGGKRRLAEVVLDAFGILGAGQIVYKDHNTDNCAITNLRWSRTLEEERDILEEKLRKIKEKLDNS